jgi:hypothetical protein
MPISTFPRHDDYEDQFLLKPAGLRDTHSEGKVTFIAFTLVFGGFECVFGRKYAQKSMMMNITLVPANGFEQAKEAVVGGRISSRG